VDESRRVLERLERIEALHASGAGAPALLGELRQLLAEGEAWAAAEGTGTARARRALGEIAAALDRDPAREEVAAVRRG
jgi:hypothetical protein